MQFYATLNPISFLFKLFCVLTNLHFGISVMLLCNFGQWSPLMFTLENSHLLSIFNKLVGKKTSHLKIKSNGNYMNPREMK